MLWQTGQLHLFLHLLRRITSVLEMKEFLNSFLPGNCIVVGILHSINACLLEFHNFLFFRSAVNFCLNMSMPCLGYSEVILPFLTALVFLKGLCSDLQTFVCVWRLEMKTTISMRPLFYWLVQIVIGWDCIAKQ